MVILHSTWPEDPPQSHKNQERKRGWGFFRLTPETGSRRPLLRRAPESQEQNTDKGRPRRSTQQNGWWTQAMAKSPTPPPPPPARFPASHSAKDPRSGPRKALAAQKRQCWGLKRPRESLIIPAPAASAYAVCGPGPGISSPLPPPAAPPLLPPPADFFSSASDGPPPPPTLKKIKFWVKFY